MKKSSKSTPTALQARAASTSTRPIPPCASLTFQPALSFIARKSAASIKIKIRRCAFLSAKIADEKRLKAEKEMASLRSYSSGNGDRSERIRTYNFPQNRVTDHRIDLTLYKLNLVMDGRSRRASPKPLVAYFHQQKARRLSAIRHI